MNTTESGPSETKQMIAINESLRAELAQAKADNARLLKALDDSQETVREITRRRIEIEHEKIQAKAENARLVAAMDYKGVSASKPADRG